MALGVELRLYDRVNAQTLKTDLVCLWWDSTDVYEFGYPQGRTDSASTDADGDLILDLSDVSGLSSGDYGYLLVRKEDGSDHKDSLVFQGRVQTTSITGGTKLVYAPSWERPADWLSLGTLPSSGTNKFLGLHAVWKGAQNVCAFKFTCSDSSQYTIDWGDGSASENVNSATTAYHIFDYDDLDGDTETGIAAARSCTFQDTGDTVTLSDHGFTGGEEISFSSITTTTGISTYTRYWVRDVSGTTFKVAATKGGSALALTNNGSGAVYLPGYRQALVTVTPTTSGKNFTALDLNVRHTSASSGSSIDYSTGWLDIHLNAPSMTTLYCGTTASGVVHVRQAFLEQFSAPELAITSCNRLFYYCRSLQSIPSLDTSSVTDFYFMFYACYNLQTFQLFNTSSGEDFAGMFSGCYNLRSIPLLDTSSGDSFSGMFSNCPNLQSIPLLDTSLATSFSGAFQGCQSLRTIPLLNTSNVLIFVSTFYDCQSLVEIPLLDTSSVEDFYGCFNQCYSLSSVPLLDTSSALDMSDMFNSCYSLRNVPLFDTSACQSFHGMFQYCSSLQTVPLFNTSASGDFENMFGGCDSLVSVPLLDVTGVVMTQFDYTFSTCYSLRRGALYGTAESISYNNCQLSGTALDEIYTNLATVTSKTITVTGNYGTASDTPSIATAKGWTVTS